ncbi:hypothetical protein ASPTUDRAFT_635119 [Aspergillus tubingensis CBS 134.48]|uniref:Uncharacterized protein n=1 Tax=Aspergillus tubingensis (strain CBS 134.48) TaxID=767770 RepID=A0A1L9N3Z5_ASPTC|nr:hypothetical protein ASPTUDRAFT_635119 [Aspergillus tubingensis CBS 134.48]
MYLRLLSENSSLLPFLLPIPVLVQPFVHRCSVVLSVLLVSPPPSQHAIFFVFSSRTPDGPSACTSAFFLRIPLFPLFSTSYHFMVQRCSFLSSYLHHKHHHKHHFVPCSTCLAFLSTTPKHVFFICSSRTPDGPLALQPSF